MTAKLKDIVLAVLAMAGLLITVKFAMTPTRANLVPRFEGGKMIGWTYRVESWWGLSSHKYQASIKDGKPVYFKEGSDKELSILPEAYDNDSHGPDDSIP